MKNHDDEIIISYFLKAGVLISVSFLIVGVIILFAKNGDDGSVGRGNRVNGIITPYRPMSMEAATGSSIYWYEGYINLFIAAATAIGVLIGAFFGAKVLVRISNENIRWIFFANRIMTPTTIKETLIITPAFRK